MQTFPFELTNTDYDFLTHTLNNSNDAAKAQIAFLTPLYVEYSKLPDPTKAIEVRSLIDRNLDTINLCSQSLQLLINRANQ